MKLKVLFAVREDLQSWPGGDTVQIQKTAAALEALGVKVTFSADPLEDLSGHDCVHLWHLERVHETYIHLLNARKHQKPILLSPIYWPRGGIPEGASPALAFRLRGMLEDVKNACRYLRAPSPVRRQAAWLAWRKGWVRCRREVLDSAVILLPNSRSEAQVLAREAPPGKLRVVVNGIDVESCRRARHDGAVEPRDGVLCVGHFDPRKNQLRLVEALSGETAPLYFIGQARQNHRGYYSKCLRKAGPRMRFLGALESEQVLRWMLKVKVHACPSLFETPGLANLEAAAMGCNLALGDCPPVREYFGPAAFYFPSRDPGAIRSAVADALEAPPPQALAESVLSTYTWEAAARETAEAYREALG